MALHIVAEANRCLNMTTRPGVFAAGDVVTGAKTVVHAVDGAKKAAEAMIRYMEEN